MRVISLKWRRGLAVRVIITGVKDVVTHYRRKDHQNSENNYELDPQPGFNILYMTIPFQFIKKNSNILYIINLLHNGYFLFYYYIYLQEFL